MIDRSAAEHEHATGITTGVVWKDLGK